MQGVKTVQAYNNLDWMAVEVENTASLDRIRSNPDVLQLVEDQHVKAFSETQYGPDWGLDSMDRNKEQLLDNKFTYSLTGAGVNIIIVDTGVRSSHQDFQGRDVTCVYNAIHSESCDDLEGHGTFVASLAAGKKYGVAKNANILSVKVLDKNGSGYTSGILDGIDKILDLVRENPTERYTVNMSLGGTADSALDDAVRALVNANVPVVVAAGNESQDACRVSPARSSHAIAVGATNYRDELASFSNFGPCVNILAPGRTILGAGRSSDTSTKTGSGTSLSAPFVAGVVALYLEHDAGLQAFNVEERILADSIDVIKEAPPSTTTDLVNTRAIAETGGCDEETSIQFQVTLRTDGYGNETSAILERHRDGIPMAVLLNLANHEIYEINACLPQDCYDFQIFDLNEDGICGGFGDGSYTVKLNGEMIKSGCDFAKSDLVPLGNCTIPPPLHVKPDPTPPPTPSPTLACKPLVLRLTTDRFASETAVRLVNDDTDEEIWNHRDLEDSTTYTWEACLDPNFCYTLKVTDSLGDGICCRYGQGSLSVTYDGETHYSDGEFGSWARFRTCGS